MEQLNTILLVDDDDATNFMNGMLIEDMGITRELLVTRNGLEAIKLIQKRCQNEGCPDLVLLDINMPVMNGFEFLEAYEQLEHVCKQSVVIVMLTTSLNPKDMHKVQQVSIDKFLNKPLTEEDLQTILRTHFHRSFPGS